MSNMPRRLFGVLEDNQWGGFRLNPKKWRWEIFQRIFALGMFSSGLSRYAITTLIVALSLGHSDMARFCHQSQQEIIRITPKKFQKLLRRLAPLTFLICVQAFQDPLCGELPHVQIFMNDGPNPLTWDSRCWAIDLVKIRLSFKINSSIWSIISGVGTVLGRPVRGVSQVEKSPHLNRVTQFLMVGYNGTCSPNVSLRIAWISFGYLPCGGGITARVLLLLKSRVAWHVSFQPL